MKAVKWGYLLLILLFLYAPIMFMIALSFNGGNSRAVWGGDSYDTSAMQPVYQARFVDQTLPLEAKESDEADTVEVIEAINKAYSRANRAKKSNPDAGEYKAEVKSSSQKYQVAILMNGEDTLTSLTVTEKTWHLLSLRWYVDLFSHSEIQNALVVTLEVAVLATVISTVIGTLAAIGVHAMRVRPQGVIMTLNNIPLTMPDIVTGISLMLLFIFTGIPRNRWTMLLAHITFDVPYVILSVLPKLRQMNPNTYEAALDLGSTPLNALFKVILPIIRPGVLTGAMLAFTLSLDDFTISYFTSPTDQNLATLIYSQSRQGVKLYMYALSTLMFVILLVLLLLVNKRSDSAIKE